MSTRPSLHATTSESPMEEDRSPSISAKEVSFSLVEIREYEQVIGDHDCFSGVPLSLGWAYAEALTQDVDVYELIRYKMRRHGHEMLMPPSVCVERLMEHGYSRHEIHRVQQERRKAKKRRRRSSQRRPQWQYQLESTIETVSKSMKRVLRQRKSDIPTWQHQLQILGDDPSTFGRHSILKTATSSKIDPLGGSFLHENDTEDSSCDSLTPNND